MRSMINLGRKTTTFMRHFVTLFITLCTLQSVSASPLTEALLQRDLARAWSLAEQGIDINTPDEDGYTPLILAAEIGAVDLVRFFIAQGAQINHRNRFGATALYKVIDAQKPVRSILEAERLEIVRLLINRGADVNLKTQQHATPLHIAALRCDRALVEILLAAGAVVSARTSTGKTPQQIASGIGCRQFATWTAPAASGPPSATPTHASPSPRSPSPTADTAAVTTHPPSPLPAKDPARPGNRQAGTTAPSRTPKPATEPPVTTAGSSPEAPPDETGPAAPSDAPPPMHTSLAPSLLPEQAASPAESSRHDPHPAMTTASTPPSPHKATLPLDETNDAVLKRTPDTPWFPPWLVILGVTVIGAPAGVLIAIEFIRAGADSALEKNRSFLAFGQILTGVVILFGGAFLLAYYKIYAGVVSGALTTAMLTYFHIKVVRINQQRFFRRHALPASLPRTAKRSDSSPLTAATSWQTAEKTSGG